MVKLSNLTQEELVVLGIEQSDLLGLVTALVKPLSQVGLIKSEHTKELISAIVDRETLSSTGLGDGLAIPHAYSRFVAGEAVVIGRTKSNLDFAAPDSKPVNLFFLLTGSEAKVTLHLQVLARLTRLLKDPLFVSELREAPSPRQIIEAIHGVECRHP